MIAEDTFKYKYNENTRVNIEKNKIKYVLDTICKKQ